jgi:hypothetical protein
LIAGHPALLDQIHHRQQPLPILGEELRQFLLVNFPLLAYRVVRFLHGGSPFKVWQPDSFRIRLNRRSNYQLWVGHPLLEDRALETIGWPSPGRKISLDIFAADLQSLPPADAKESKRSARPHSTT